MSGLVRRRDGARRDLVAIYVRYTRVAGLKVADRFNIEAEVAFRRLASMPGLGARFETDDPRLGELRYFPLPSRFRKFLVFYQPFVKGVEIVRVLHGARDILGILTEDFGVEDGDVADDQGV